MNTKMNLEEKVQQWFIDRNLHEANPVKQFLKLMEESGELLLMVSSLGNIAQKLYSHVCHNETQTPLIKSDLMFLDSVVSTVSFCNGTTAESFQLLEKRDKTADHSSMENQMPPSFGASNPMDIPDDGLPF
jgi:single-stranded DNA-binding protein 4